MKKLLIGSGILILVVIALHVVFDYGSFIQVSGASMEPTYHSGDWFYATHLASPKINDVIYFDCFSKCTDNYRYNHVREITLIKRIAQIDGDKIWVEGDNKEYSTDSRVYGWLSPSDIKLLGVVIQ